MSPRQVLIHRHQALLLKQRKLVLQRSLLHRLCHQRIILLQVLLHQCQSTVVQLKRARQLLLSRR